MVDAMSTAEMRGDWEGLVVDGRFTLLQWLGGSGGSGVFLTELPEDRSQRAVIKLMAVDPAGAEAQIASWAATSALSHPHLMRLFHTGQTQIDDVPLLYVVTEYAEEILSQILSERPLTALEAREMLEPVLDALSYLHGKGFVHGHLRPSTVMVVGNHLKLSANRIQPAGERSKFSPAPEIYDAPERATATITASADVWSLGVTLVEALTQHPPAWDRFINEDPTWPESIPQPFADIARDCLRYHPSLRCTISDIKAHLEPAPLLPKPASTIGDLPRPASETAKTVSSKFPFPAIIAAGLVLIVVIAILVSHSHQAEPSKPAASRQPAPVSAAPPAQSPVTATPTAKGTVVKGEVAERVMPEVLPSANASIQGKISVNVRVTVDPSGEVSNATLDRPGPSRYFAKVALQAAQHWRFKPAQVDGQPTSSVWILQFQFKRSATEVTPVTVSP